MAAFGTAPFFIQSPYGGIDYDIVKIWASKLNFQMDITVGSDWLGYDPDKEMLTGVIASLHYGEASIAISELSLDPYVFKLMHYIFVYNFPILYISAKPERLPPFLNLTKPFTWRTWTVLLVLFLMTITLFVAICRSFADSIDSVSAALLIYKIQINQGTYIYASYERKFKLIKL